MEEPIKYQGALDEINPHQIPYGKPKVKISLCRSKSYQRKNIEKIRSIFDQGRPVVSHIEVCIPNEPPAPNNIGGGLKDPQRQLWKEYLFVQNDKNKKFSLL